MQGVLSGANSGTALGKLRFQIRLMRGERYCSDGFEMLGLATATAFAAPTTGTTTFAFTGAFATAWAATFAITLAFAFTTAFAARATWAIFAFFGSFRNVVLSFAIAFAFRLFAIFAASLAAFFAALLGEFSELFFSQLAVAVGVDIVELLFDAFGRFFL